MAPHVAIAGAGPSGMTAALFLARQGIAVTVLERHQMPFADPRAATIHPPTMELYAESGVTEALHRRGIVAPVWQFRGREEGVIAEFDLGQLADCTPFPYRLQCEQHKLVEVLIDKLAAFPHARIKWGTVVQDVAQDASGVTLATTMGTLRADYLIGADGGRSVVRKSQNIGFDGFTYPERFLVITTPHDFGADGFAISSYVSDPREWCALFKVPGTTPEGLWRVVFPTDPAADDSGLLDFVAAERRLQGLIPRDGPYQVVHTNLYAVHQRVASAFRAGRVLLAGDAAHVNNPLGGMGMNFGIHDAANAAEKLGAVLRGADDTLLDRYDRQRRHVAKAFLQAMTIANKQNLEEKDPVARQARLDGLRATAADPARARAHLLKTSMIDGFAAAAAIA
ncbi:FAD-dependent oxidoreductase [Humitalea sp. 24SJ18S-53]|uniref:FAD-dependent oxidoreductase n=1 Tax=Humitalea sp. 24SJ18S-53 TaxID=3422307 RepID=UPI003D6695C1